MQEEDPSGQKRKREDGGDADGGPPTAGLSEEELRKMKIPELKDLLRSHNLPVSGVKADLIARLLAAQVGGVSVSASPSSSSSSSSRGGRAELLAAGVSAEDTDATEPATVKKDMTGYVKTVAEMVDADWHDGYEEQGEELDSYFKAMAKVAKAVYRVAVAKAVGFHRCNEVMKAMADSWANMLTIPMRGSIEESVSYSDTTFDLVDHKQKSVSGVPDLIGFIWRQLLVAAAKAGVADDLMWRYIKDASDNSVDITDFSEEDEDEGEDQPSNTTEPRQEESVPGRARLVELYNNSAKWQGLPTTVKVHKQRRGIDRRFDGPVNRRTRDYHLYDF